MSVYFLAGGRTGGTTGGLEPELVVVNLPDASRWALLQFPDGWHCAVAVPVVLPEASRNPEVTELPDFRVSALPVMRPLASL